MWAVTVREYRSDTRAGSKLVSVFDRQGKKLRDINDGSLVRPNGVAVDRKNDRVYVVSGHYDSMCSDVMNSE